MLLLLSSLLFFFKKIIYLFIILVPPLYNTDVYRSILYEQVYIYVVNKK